MKNQEIIRILIQQIEANLAAIKVALAEDDEKEVLSDIRKEVQPVVEKIVEKDKEKSSEKPVSEKKDKKKKKLKIVSKEDLMAAFGTHDVSTESEQEEVEEEKPGNTEKEKKVSGVKAASATPVAAERPTLHYTDHSINLSDITGEDEDAAEEMLGKSILKHLRLEDDNCSVLRLQKKYYDNGLEKLYIDKWHVNVTLLNDNMKVIAEKTVGWKALMPFHYQLIGRGINKYSKSDDPHKNYMPQTINLDLG